MPQLLYFPLVPKHILIRLLLMGALMGLLLIPSEAFAQVKIGDNQANVNPNSLLELESSSKGLLIPRMTTEQRDAAFQVDTAPVGLIIFNTTEQVLQILQQAEKQW